MLNDSNQYDLSNKWIVKIKSQNPDYYQQIMLNLNHVPRYGIRVNKTKISQNDYIGLLNQNNILFDVIEDIIVLSNLSTVDNIPYFNNGYVSIQDINAQKLLELIQFNGK